MLRRSWVLVAAWCAAAAVASAGAFLLTIHAPGPGADAGTVLTVRAEGCQDYSHANVTGRAEGLVQGRRQSVALKLVPAGTPGTYAVRRQWPAEGKWVLVFQGTAGGRQTHTIVELGPDGRLKPASAPSKGIRMTMRPVSDAELMAILTSGV
jgi:hypothetical protein